MLVSAGPCPHTPEDPPGPVWSSFPPAAVGADLSLVPPCALVGAPVTAVTEVRFVPSRWFSGYPGVGLQSLYTQRFLRSYLGFERE